MSAGERPAVLWLPPMPQATIERLQRTFDAVLLEDPTTLPEAPERFRGLAATVAAGASRDLLSALPNLESAMTASMSAMPASAASRSPTRPTC
jgi:hypothetical protein